MKRVLSLLMALSLVVVMAACSGGGNSAGTTESTSSSEEAATEEAAATEDYSNVKIGVLLSGSANDGGWSQMGADAATAAAEAFPGSTTNFSESLAASDYESVMRGYADQGYSIIVAHGAEFLDVSKQVAADYPDTVFINTSALEGDYPLPNLTGVDFSATQLGFLCGVACALASESGKIGTVGSMEVDSLLAWEEGVEAGAKYINPDAVVSPVWTGTFDDALKGKQAVDSLKELGVDVITVNADAAGIGAAQQCDEYDIKCVGSVFDHSAYGETSFVSFNQDAQLGITLAIEQAIEGTLPAGHVRMGADVGVISITGYSGKYADSISDEGKAQIEELLELAKTDPVFASILGN